MADATVPSTGNWYDPLVNVGSSLLGSTAATAAQNQMANALSQGSNIYNTAYNQAALALQPYATAGTQALPGYAASTQQVGQPLTMQQFQASPYWQVGQTAANQGRNALEAQAVAGGMYGSGNVANAMQQNYLNAMMGAYDTASQRNLANQQASNTAQYNLANMGMTGSQALANQALRAAEAQSGFALQGGNLAAQGTSAQNAYLAQILKNAPELVKSGFNWLSNYLGPQQDSSFLNAAASNYPELPFGYDPMAGSYTYGLDTTMDPTQGLYSGGLFDYMGSL